MPELRQGQRACVPPGDTVTPATGGPEPECLHCGRRLDESPPGWLDVIDTSYLYPGQMLSAHDFPDDAQWHEPGAATKEGSWR